MAFEIERKFLLKPGVNVKDIEKMAKIKVDIGQAYLSPNPDVTVRVRRIDKKGYLTVKTRNSGIKRHEWEYEIPLHDAMEMLELPTVRGLTKTRYLIPYGGHQWEVDVFHGRLDGLVTAEVELEHENQSFDIPDFVGREISHDVRFFNSNLIDTDFESLKDMLGD